MKMMAAKDVGETEWCKIMTACNSYINKTGLRPVSRQQQDRFKNML
jgi:hypothetical protein